MRFIDKLWRQGLRIEPFPQVFLVQNVIDYFYLHQQDLWQEEDMINVAPPFMSVWLEGSWPKVWRIKGKLVSTGVMGSQSFAFHLEWVEATKEMTDMVQPLPYERGRVEAVGGPDKIKWRLRWRMFTQSMPTGEVMGDCLVAEDGQMATCTMAHKPHSLAQYTNSDYIDGVRTFLYSQLLAVCFMHCKNVAMVEHVPDDDLQKATMKRHGIELVRYYTLDIDPMKQTLKTEGSPKEKNWLQRAFHLCRGHFANYTAEKPLFGRTVGTIWIPNHVRGKLDEGVIMKDYDVKAGVTR